MENETAVQKVVEQFVNDPTNYKAGQELIIRTGEAVVIEKARSVGITGSIDAPFEFYSKRKDGHSADSCHLLINRNLFQITLVCDERSPIETIIVGLLRANKDLQAFKINKVNNPNWGVKELQTFLKMNKYFFNDKEECVSIVTKLMNFTARFDTEIKNIDDQRGNALISLEKKLITEIPLGFSLSMPIFIGMAPKTFKVEICCSASSAGVSFWLDSGELREIELTERDRAIDEQKANFSEIVCIETI